MSFKIAKQFLIIVFLTVITNVVSHLLWFQNRKKKKIKGKRKSKKRKRREMGRKIYWTSQWWWLCMGSLSWTPMDACMDQRWMRHDDEIEPSKLEFWRSCLWKWQPQVWFVRTTLHAWLLFPRIHDHIIDFIYTPNRSHPKPTLIANKWEYILLKAMYIITIITV